MEQSQQQSIKKPPKVKQKKGGGGGSNSEDPKNNFTVQSKEILKRLNYLYQISNFLINSNGNYHDLINSKERKDERNGKGNGKGKGKGKERNKQIMEGNVSLSKEEEEREGLIPTQPLALAGSDQMEVSTMPTEIEYGYMSPIFSVASPPPNINSIQVEDMSSEPRHSALTPPPPVIASASKLPYIPERKSKKSAAPRRNLQQATPAQILISKTLTKMLKEVAKKATIRVDPTVKRTVCKKCGMLLVPGVSCTVRIKPSGPHAHVIVKTCTGCNHKFRLPAPPHLPPTPEFSPSIRQSTSTGVTPILVDQVEAEGGVGIPEDLEVEEVRKLSKREKREKRQARKPTFFERKGHVTIAGEDQIVFKDVY